MQLVPHNLFQSERVLSQQSPASQRQPAVNFINILRAAFETKLLRQKKLQSQNITRDKLRKRLSVEKGVCKTMMKSTPGFIKTKGISMY